MRSFLLQCCHVNQRFKILAAVALAISIAAARFAALR